MRSSLGGTDNVREVLNMASPIQQPLVVRSLKSLRSDSGSRQETEISVYSEERRTVWFISG